MKSNMCEIIFHMRFETSDTESVRIIGNLPEMGNWDPAKGLALVSQEDDPSLWVSPKPIKVEKRTRLEFKCVVVEGQIVKRWEKFEKDSHRKYKARYIRTILKGTENDDGGKECIIEKGSEEDANTEEIKPQVEPSPKHNEFKSKGSDLGLDDNPEINRPLIGSFNPLEWDKESEDSNNSSIIENAYPEGSPPKRQNFTKIKKKLAEIESEKSSDSLLEVDVVERRTEINAPVKTILSFSMVFTKLKDKFFRKKAKTPLKLHQGDKLNFEGRNHSVMAERQPKFDENFDRENDAMIVVCKFLPIKLSKDESGCFQGEIIRDSNQFYLSRHLLNGSYRKVLCVGMLREYIEESDRKEIDKLLRKSFNCLPIFLNHDVKEMFLLSHEIFSMLDSLMTLSSKSLYIDNFWAGKHSAWEVLKKINLNYCNVLKEFRQSEYKCILISDYHFILTPKMLINENFNLTVGFYFNGNFPTFEVFRLFPFKDEFLAGLLNTDIIYFNCFEQARSFQTALLLEKNLKIQSKNGVFYFTSDGRTTFLKLKSVTIDTLAIRSLPKIPMPFIECLLSNNHNIILGLDRISELTGVDLKMKFIAQWIKESHNKHNVMFIQILQKPYYGPLSEKQKLWLDHIKRTLQDLNAELEMTHNPLIQLYQIDPNEQESLYLMSRAKVLINASIKNEYCIDSMKFVLTTENCGHVLISEFMNYNRSCSSIFTFNPLKYSDFKEKIEALFRMQPQVSKDLIQQDVAYLTKFPIDSWFSLVFSDLKSLQRQSQLSALHAKSGSPLAPTIPMFQMHTFSLDYHRSNNRIFIFEFFGSLVRSTSVTDLNRFSKKSVRRSYQLNENLMNTLRLLVQDERNIVYVITSKSANNLDIALGNIHEIGLVAESGYLYKLKGKNKWSKLISIDWSWKEVVRRNMENYTKNTFGSTLEIKESALVWNYENAPSELAEIQSLSLISHLKNGLEKIRDVEIIVGNKFVEVRPIGISKGNFVRLLLQSYQKVNDLDFIMVMGADTGTFKTVREFIGNNTEKGLDGIIKNYLIWVGANRSEGDYQLNSREDVGELMQQLTDVLFF